MTDREFTDAALARTLVERVRIGELCDQWRELRDAIAAADAGDGGDPDDEESFARLSEEIADALINAAQWDVEL